MTTAASGSCGPSVDSAGEDVRLARARAGDRDALDRLARTYRPRLERFVVLMGVGEPEDVAQQALQEGLGSLDRFTGRSQLSSWLLGIALNHARRWLRKAAAKSSPRLGEDLDRMVHRSPDRSIFSEIVRREDAKRVALALDALPAAYRESFVLHHVEELDFAEVGRLTGVATGTARVRAHRARTLLQEDLGPAFLTLFRRRENPAS